MDTAEHNNDKHLITIVKRIKTASSTRELRCHESAGRSSKYHDSMALANFGIQDIGDT